MPRARIRPRSARTWSSASSKRVGVAAAGDGQLGALAAAAADGAGRLGDQLGGVQTAVRASTAATSAAPLPPGELPSTTARHAGAVPQRDREVAERRSRDSHSTWATTTPSTAAASSSSAWFPASSLRRTFSSSRSDLQLAERRSMPSTRSSGATPTRSAARAQHALLVVPQPLDRTDAGDGLDPADVRADRTLRDHLERADVAQGAARGCRRRARCCAARPRAPGRRRRTSRRRTRSAPSARASSIEVSKWRTGALERISWLARSSIAHEIRRR